MMSKYLRLFSLVIAFIAVLATGSTVLAQTTALSSTFTYQGYLSNNGSAVTDTCDFVFELYPAVSGGTKIGSTLTRTTGVSGGVFTVQLDFGASAFNGDDRFLDIKAVCPTGGTPVQLSPRSPVTSAPAAIFAANAANATTAGSATVANGLTALTIQTNVTSPNLIGGFSGNTVLAGVVGATIGGGGLTGQANLVTDNYGTVSGGQGNQAGNNDGTFDNIRWATVAGGVTNTAAGAASFVGGGEGNAANSLYSAVVGGNQNTANNQHSFVGGGFQNSAGGEWSTIPGGNQNSAAGNYSFAAGNRAKANAAGSFVWADSTAADLANNTANSFVVRASGGYILYTDSGATTGVTLSNGSGTWGSVSDRNVKDNFQLVNPHQVLQDVVSMPISTWNYIAQGDTIRHIGPMAQDFYAAFGVGEDDKHITTIDADGVALAAIQGLYQVVQDKDAQITALQTENAELKTLLDDLDQRLSALEALASPSQAGVSLPMMLMGVVLVGGVGFAGRCLLRKDASL